MIELKLTPKQASLLTGLSEVELEDLLESADDKGAVLFEKARERSKTLSDAKVKEGYSKLGRRATQLLRPLAEKYGFELGETIEESMEALQTALSDVPKGSAGELTKEELASNPIVKAIVAERLKSVAEKYDAEKKALELQVNETRKAATKATAAKAIAEILRAENAVLGQATPEKASEIALNLIGLDNIQIDQSGNIVITNGGQPATDDFGNALSLADAVKANWVMGFNSVDPGKQGGNPPPPGAGKKADGKYNFASAEEAQKLLSNPKITAQERMEIFKAIAEL